jgi:hypothetical protein
VRRLVVGPVLAAVVLLSAPPTTVAGGEPASLASIGDSITRATNAFGWYGDHPSLSWSTGFNPLDGLDSHYERLMSQDPLIFGNEYNLAEAGARMADAPAQATQAVLTGADYVTILMGANDLCAPSVAQMTPVVAFGADLEQTLTTLTSGLPDARIFVSSIPNLERLAEIWGDDPIARFVWDEARICPTVLDRSNTWLDRMDVALREHAYNLVLAAICGRYPACRSDGFAVYRHDFARDEVSRLDFFHPSLEGQHALAALTWSSGWWA